MIFKNAPSNIFSAGSVWTMTDLSTFTGRYQNIVAFNNLLITQNTVHIFFDVIITEVLTSSGDWNSAMYCASIHFSIAQSHHSSSNFRLRTELLIRGKDYLKAYRHFKYFDASFSSDSLSFHPITYRKLCSQTHAKPRPTCRTNGLLNSMLIWVSLENKLIDDNPENCKHWASTTASFHHQ